jgi:hypothetical protein
MPKINARSYNNNLTTFGILNVIDSKIDQSVLTTSDVTFNSLNITTEATINNPTLTGIVTYLNSDVTQMKDNIIEINSEETGNGVTLNLSGIEINRGNLTNFQLVFDESLDTFRYGPIGSLKNIAGIELTPLSNGIVTWNDTLQYIEAGDTVIIDITLNSGTNPSTTNDPATLSIVGGASITQDLVIDGSIKIKGSNYGNIINSDVSNNLILTSIGDINFIVDSSKVISIPTNVKTTYGSISNYIVFDGTNLSIISSNDINLTPDSGSNINIPSNSSIAFGSTSNQLYYDNTDMIFDLSSKFILHGNVTITELTSSSNSTTGALVISGGLGVGENLNISGNLDVDSITTLDQTSIDTTSGSFSVTGTNNIDFEVTNSSNFTVTSGTLTLSGIGTTIQSNSGKLLLSSTNDIDIGGNDSGLPIYIGHPVSLSTVRGDLTVLGDLIVSGSGGIFDVETILIEDHSIIVNSSPSGLGDGGLMVKRYQTSNNVSSGDVINDTPYETSTYQSGSTLPDTLILNASASSINDHYKGMWIHDIVSGQIRRIKTYNGTTKTVTIYITADGSINDGLDLISVPTVGQTYRIFNKPYIGSFYRDSTDSWVIGYTSYDSNTGFIPFQEYIQLHVNNLITETTSVIAPIIIDSTNTEAFVVRKLSNTGDIFKVDTLTETVTINGNVSFSGVITNPIITTSNLTNITSVTSHNVILDKYSTKYSLSLVFRLIPSTGSVRCSFEFTIPNGFTFTNLYDIIPIVKGFYDDSNHFEVMNITCIPIIGTTRAKIYFTSADNTNVHTLQVNINYIN